MVATDSLSAGARRVLQADAAMAGLILLLGAFLAVTGNTLLQQWRSSAVRQRPVSFEDLFGITANLAGVVVIIWWAVSLLVAFAAALLERGGRTRAASAAGRFSPGFMRRLALAAVGLQLVTAQFATAATLPVPPADGHAPETAVSGAWVPALNASWADEHQGPAPAGPAAVPAAQDMPAPDPQWKPLHPVADPGLLAPGQLRPPDPAAPPGDVTVRTGDSLWSLSAAQLGPFASDVDIAAAWPRLYQGNRKIIGEDPNALLPGQVLRLPPSI